MAKGGTVKGLIKEKDLVQASFFTLFSGLLIICRDLGVFPHFKQFGPKNWISLCYTVICYTQDLPLGDLSNMTKSDS